MIPELIILISTAFGVASVVVLYFHRSNPAATGVAVLSGIVLLYGVGQYGDRDRGDGRTRQYLDVADKRDMKVSTAVDGDGPKQPSDNAQIGDKTIRPAERPAPESQADNTDSPAKDLPLPEPSQLSSIGVAPPTVMISNISVKKAIPRYLDVSATVTNTNEFAIKNIQVKCGDPSYASGDVSALIDKIVPAKSNLQIADMRMGPIKTQMPPSVCRIAAYDRAD